MTIAGFAIHSPYSGTARLNCCSSQIISSCVRLIAHQYKLRKTLSRRILNKLGFCLILVA